MKFTNSPLVSYTRISPNKGNWDAAKKVYTPERNHKIDTVSIHCVAGQCSVETVCSIFASPKRQASSNYIIGVDGKIGMAVEEKDRSWCTSSASNDNRAITIEVASDSKHPYAVNSAAYSALIDLLVDICERNNIKKLLWKGDKRLIGNIKEQNMTVHRWFANKACPGDYLYNKHREIADRVNARLAANKDKVFTLKFSTNSKFKVGDVVKITGQTYYDGTKVPGWVKKQKWVVSHATSSRVVVNKSKGGKYAINSPFKPSDLTKLAAAPKKRPLTEVAKDVYEGKYGNGAVRISKLKSEGYDPQEVQALVNKLFS